MGRIRTITPAVESRMLSLREQGLTHREIGKKLGYNHRSVGKTLRSLRDSGEWQVAEIRDAETNCPSLDSALREFADWIGSDAEAAARSRQRRGTLYDCETDIRPGSEGYIEEVEL